MGQFLSQLERLVLGIMDHRILAGMTGDKPLKKIVVSQGEAEHLRNIVRKKRRGPIYDDYGEVEAFIREEEGQLTYRGVGVKINGGAGGPAPSLEMFGWVAHQVVRVDKHGSDSCGL